MSAWVPYSLQQIGMWYLIAKGQQKRPKYIFGLHSFNVWAIALNGFFMLVHVFQTRYFYDALAQDVHESSSMMSVILMLLLILLMENNRRGLVFGYKVKPLLSIGEIVKRYHGYYLLVSPGRTYLGSYRRLRLYELAAVAEQSIFHQVSRKSLVDGYIGNLICSSRRFGCVFHHAAESGAQCCGDVLVRWYGNLYGVPDTRAQFKPAR